MGIRPDAPHRKCARVVGDTMGKYHPHGDSAIYDALVRMGQDFTRGITLIDPQGNFGSLDDPPAAYRYTECRLTDAAMEMVGEIDEDTVDFRPTYDGESTEPVYLPALLPNLLVNGTSGIAVGMATNMAPHNLRRGLRGDRAGDDAAAPEAHRRRTDGGAAGPDFPSGGIVVDDGLREAYETGRGSSSASGPAPRSNQLTAQPPGHRRHRASLHGRPREGRQPRSTSSSPTASSPGVDDVKNLSDRTAGLRYSDRRCKPGCSPERGARRALPA